MNIKAGAAVLYLLLLLLSIYIAFVKNKELQKEKVKLLMEKSLNESEISKDVLLNNLLGMAYRCSYDREWTMQFVSAGCFELTGYLPESLLNNKVLSFNELIVPKYRDKLWSEWEMIISLNKQFKYEYEIITASGKQKWVMEMGQGIYDEAGNVEGLGGIIIDITEQKEHIAQIQYINDHDYLTDIYNRKYYEEKMAEMGENCLPISIILIDINGVRLINDAFGYLEGDKLIRETSKFLQSCCVQRDILARIGCDEFGILLPNTDSKTANKMINSIEKACAYYNESNKIKLYEINLSIGFATKKTSEDSIEKIAQIADENLRNRKLFSRNSYHSVIISSIMATVYEKSHETEEHSKRIAHLAKEIGKKLNLSQKSLGELELLALLHDIGKVGIDERVLKKHGALDEDEWIVMKKHPEIGYRIAKSSSELEPIAECILSHHERWDGNGYPQGLKGEDIPLLSRIIAVVDAYDAMSVNRVYRKALTREQTIDEIKNNAGKQFDPNIAKIFIEDTMYAS